MKKVSLPRSLVCLAMIGGIAIRPVAGITTLNVDATHVVRTVDERVFGLNAVCWDSAAASAQTIDLLQAAGVRAIRLPGGSLSDEYHWKTNTNLDNTFTWATGFNGFAQVVTSLNAQAFVTANYGTGTPEEAAAWVAYANAPANLQGTPADVTIGVDTKGTDWHTAGYWSALRASAPLTTDDGSNFLRVSRTAPIGLKFWELGNECYGASWETDQQIVPHDPYTYATRARDYMAKMKAVDPTIKVGVVVTTGEDTYANNTSHPATNPRTHAVHNGWTPVLLTTLKSLDVTPDFAIYHRYEQNPGSESDASLLQDAKTWPNDAADLRQQLTDYLGADGARVELTVTENNSVSYNPGKQTTSLVNALFYADSVANVLQTEFNSLIWWDVRNGPDFGENNSASLYGWRLYGDYGVLTSPAAGGPSDYYTGYPAYYALKLLSYFARGGDQIVPVTSNNNFISGYAAKRADGTLALLVINKSAAATIPVNFVINGYAPAADATAYSYGMPQDTAAENDSGSTDIAQTSLTGVSGNFTTSFVPYSISVLALAPSGSIAPAFTVPPQNTAALAGGSVTLTAAAAGSPAPAYQWQRNGADVTGGSSAALVLSDVQPADAGLYNVIVTNSAGSSTSADAILGIATSAKVVGDGSVIATNILHPNGNHYDQVLLTGTAAAITADAGKVTRTSYIDDNDDIVQVEFAGPGTLSLVLDDLSGPALPVNYNQDVNYMKGHAGIAITGATEQTNVLVFTVGRATAFDPTSAYNILQAPNTTTNNPANNGSPLFVGHTDTVYDGVADIAFIAIASTNGQFGGVRTADARYTAAQGLTGIYAPGVEFNGPIYIGNISASGNATPVIQLGSALTNTAITGGNLAQANTAPVQVSGLTHLTFQAGTNSNGDPLPAQANQAVLEQNDQNVTSQIVVNP